MRAQLFAALTAAHAELINDSPTAATLVVAWERRHLDPRIHVLYGGHPVFPPATDAITSGGEPEALLFPPGSTAEMVDTREVLRYWTSLPAWIRCTGQFDALWTPTPDQALRRQPRGGFDDYITHLREPFTWLLLAEPLTATILDDELSTLEIQIPTLRQRENSEPGRVALERAQARYRELSRARTSGMWHLHVLIGGARSRNVRRAAALLCSASDLDELPYVLFPHSHAATGLNEVLSTTIDDPDQPQSPFAATAELLAALTRPPKHELPGINLTDRTDFDVTPETSNTGKTIALGDVLDDGHQRVGSFIISDSTLNRHTFVTGATGAGKSQTIRYLLEGLYHAAIPWLVIEPAKAEYARMAGRIGADQVTVIRPGDPDVVPVGLNPLEPEPGFPLQTHIDMLRALFLAAFDASDPFPQVLSQALARCYNEVGWDTTINMPRNSAVTPKYPTLGDLQRAAVDVVERIGYGKEVTDNVRGFVDIRIGSLRFGAPGRFFEGGHPLDVADLLRRNTVLEIEDIGNDQDKAFFIGVVLIRLYEQLRTQPISAGQGLRHLTVIEEAHRLLKRAPPGSQAAQAVELFTALLAETRAYGEGILVAEQIPSKITQDVIKNTALKIVHRLPAHDDRHTVGATMNLTEAQSRHLVSLPPGRAAAFADGMDHPVRIQVPLGEDREYSAGAVLAATTTRPRSAACSERCRSVHCVLRTINHGTHLANDPELTLWIELLAAAHLVGMPAPTLTWPWIAAITARAAPPILDCAITHRVETAVNSRYPSLALHYQPESLANHLATQARGQLNGTIQPCDGTEVEWQAGRYRWVDVCRSLLQDDSHDVDLPHPDTESWARRGLHLVGRTQAEQLAELKAHPDYWRPSPTVITGTESPPIYAAAINQLSRAPESRGRFLEASKFLRLTTEWPIRVLVDATTARTPEQR